MLSLSGPGTLLNRHKNECVERSDRKERKMGWDDGIQQGKTKKQGHKSLMNEGKDGKGQERKGLEVICSDMKLEKQHAMKGRKEGRKACMHA